MTLTGACACGAVTYTIQDDSTIQTASVCHCKICQAWSGGVFVYVESNDCVVKDPEKQLTVWESSDWAERAFCKTCGSSVYCRITAPGPMQGVYHFGAGTLKEWKGIDKLQTEIFIDRKPDTYTFQGDSKKLTAEEIFALWSGGDKNDEK